MAWCLMDEFIMNLTSMASLSKGDSVRNHLRPIIAKSSKSVLKLGIRLVSYAHTIMSFPVLLVPLCVIGSRAGFHHVTGNIMFA